MGGCSRASISPQLKELQVEVRGARRSKRPYAGARGRAHVPLNSVKGIQCCARISGQEILV